MINPGVKIVTDQSSSKLVFPRKRAFADVSQGVQGVVKVAFSTSFDIFSVSFILLDVWF